MKIDVTVKKDEVNINEVIRMLESVVSEATGTSPKINVTDLSSNTNSILLNR